MKMKKMVIDQNDRFIAQSAWMEFKIIFKTQVIKQSQQSERSILYLQKKERKKAQPRKNSLKTRTAFFKIKVTEKNPQK